MVKRVLVAVAVGLALPALAAAPSTVVNVKDYGAIGDGATNDSSAVNAAAYAAVTQGGALYFPKGIYLVDTVDSFGPRGGSVIGLLIYGDGPGRSIVRSRSGATVFELTARTVHTWTMRDLSIEGQGATTGAGHGIHVHDNAFDDHVVKLQNLRIMNLGGKGVYLPKTFSVHMDTVLVSSCGGNLIEGRFDVAATFTNVYIGRVLARRYGFHVYSGHPVFIGCNGIDRNSDDGASWGLFGRSRAEGGVTDRSYPVFIGTNFEDIRGYGVRFVSGSFGSFHGAGFKAAPACHATGCTLPVAISYEGAGEVGLGSGIFDGQSSIGTVEATWRNGYAIHSSSGVAPIVIQAPGGYPTKGWRSDASSTFDLAQVYLANTGEVVHKGRFTFGTADVTGYDFTVSPHALLYNPSAGNDARTTFLSLLGGADRGLGPLRFHLGVYPSAAAASRYVSLQVNDAAGPRQLKLNPDGGVVEVGSGGLQVGGGITRFGTGAATLRGAVVDGPTAVANKFANRDALNAPGAKIAAFYTDGAFSVEKRAIGRSGEDIYAAKGDSTRRPGPATINQAAGRSAIARGASSIVVTNNIVDESSIVFAQLQGNDATATFIKSVIPRAGSFTVTVNAAASADLKLAWVVMN